MEVYAFILILVLCAVLFIAAVRKRKMELFLNFVLKLAAGAVGIYVLNMLLGMSGVDGLVGFNPINVLTVGVLGLPGLAMLYGIGFYYTL